MGPHMGPDLCCKDVHPWDVLLLLFDTPKIIRNDN